MCKFQNLQPPAYPTGGDRGNQPLGFYSYYTILGTGSMWCLGSNIRTEGRLQKVASVKNIYIQNWWHKFCNKLYILSAVLQTFFKKTGCITEPLLSSFGFWPNTKIQWTNPDGPINFTGSTACMPPERYSLERPSTTGAMLFHLKNN